MKTIIVTGASGDIGSAIVRAMSEAGFKVYAVIRNKDDSVSLQTIKNVSVLIADTTDTESIKKLETEIKDPVDWIITAQGYIDSNMEFETQKGEEIELTFKVNILSLFYLAQIFLKRISTGMIFIGSTSGITANGKIPVYSASKAAVNSFASALARNKTDKFFLSLCPGPTLGKMRERLGAKGGQEPSVVANLVKEIILPNTEYKSGDVVSIRDGNIKIESRLE